MKKVISLLLVFICAIGLVSSFSSKVNEVKAEDKYYKIGEADDTWGSQFNGADLYVSAGSYGPINANQRGGRNLAALQYGLVFKKNGQIVAHIPAYCISPGIPQPTSEALLGSDESLFENPEFVNYWNFLDGNGIQSGKLSDYQKELLSLVTYFGYGYKGHEELYWQRATQYIIWEVCTYGNLSSGSIPTASYDLEQGILYAYTVKATGEFKEVTYPNDSQFIYHENLDLDTIPWDRPDWGSTYANTDKYHIWKGNDAYQQYKNRVDSATGEIISLVNQYRALPKTAGTAKVLMNGVEVSTENLGKMPVGTELTVQLSNSTFKDWSINMTNLEYVGGTPSNTATNFKVRVKVVGNASLSLNTSNNFNDLGNKYGNYFAILARNYGASNREYQPMYTVGNVRPQFQRSSANYEFTMEGVGYNIKFDKVDGNGNHVNGAQLRIVNEDTNVTMHEWNSSDGIKTFLLLPGNYRLEEVTAPDCYVKAAPIRFRCGT